MRTYILELLLLASFASPAQTIIGYRKSTLPNNQPLIFALYSDGSRQCVTSIPANPPTDRVGGLVKLTYTPEPIRTLNTDQFGLGKYFDPNFKFLVDYRPIGLDAAQMRSRGQNLFSTLSFPNGGEFNNLPTGQKLVYATESGLHGHYEGHRYWVSSLEEIESYYNSNIANVWDLWTANIESSTVSWPGDNTTGPLPGYPQAGYGRTHYPSWAEGKNAVINLESTGEQNVSLETLASRGQGAWTSEIDARRGNRTRIMLQIAARKNPAGLVAYGSSMYQGQPDKSTAYDSGAFFASSGSTALYPADAQGFSTVNGRKYKLAGDDFYADESFHLDYYYVFNFDIGQQDYNDIWRDNLPGKTNYPYIWSKIKPVHVVADQIGHFQANEVRIKGKAGQQNRPVMVMREVLYEGDQAGYVENSSDRVARVPSGMNAGCIDFTPNDNSVDCNDFPKIWIPPYIQYSYYVTARWFYANRPNSGYYLWNAPGYYDLSAANAPNNHHLHSITALFQARHDMQIYERFLGQSTLVETPEVQANQTGVYTTYDAIQAYNYSQGSKGPQKPVFQLRYLAQANGYRVVILGGDILNHGEERTHNVRHTFPGMGGPVTFKIKLRGPAAQVFEFVVSNQDSGQTHEATPTPQVGFERAGYAGRVPQN